MSSDRDLADDLVVLARRGDLPRAEERRLRDALTASPETRVLFDAGRGFDEEAEVQPGDAARLERMVRNVEQRRRAVERRRASRRVAAAALAVGLTGALAVAAVQLGRSLSRASSERATDAPRAPDVPRAPARSARPEAARAPASLSLAPAGTAEPVEAHEAAAEGRAEPALTSKPASQPPPMAQRGSHRSSPAFEQAPAASTMSQSADAPTASSTSRFSDAPPVDAARETPAGLFAAANRARMSGDAPGAIAAYERLEAEFPSSPEATTATLSLGMLYLQQSRNDRALAAFEQSARGGAPPAEALWGEAQALRRLGQVEDERAVLERLLRDHPASAYVAAARKRLSDLR